MELGLQAKNILVVGASKGIGRAVAIAFAKEKTNITAIARSKELLDALEQDVKSSGALSYRSFVQDITSGDCREFSQEILGDCGIFDVVVHCVGGSPAERDGLSGSEQWLDALRWNALAAIDMNSVLIPPMVEQGYGKVIHISSNAAFMLRGNPLYASSKAFLNAYVTTAGRQLASKGVMLCSVMPGVVQVPGNTWDINVRHYPEKCEDLFKHHQAIHRLETPEEIADMVVFLASERATCMHGNNLVMDGGGM